MLLVVAEGNLEAHRRPLRVVERRRQSLVPDARPMSVHAPRRNLSGESTPWPGGVEGQYIFSARFFIQSWGNCKAVCTYLNYEIDVSGFRSNDPREKNKILVFRLLTASFLKSDEMLS